MNAKHWEVKPGQLRDEDVIDSGYRNRDDATRHATNLDSKYCAVVRRLHTTESDYPANDSRHDPFSSARWCIVVRAGV